MSGESGMSPRLRSATTLTVLLVLLIVFALLGWHWATRPFPARAAAQLCVDRPYDAGDKLSPSDITVSVLNASDRVGLAGRTLSALELHHFGVGDQANAPKHATVPRLQIWTEDPHSPAVHLVARWLPHPTIIKRASSLPGITVVVGQGFTNVKAKGPDSVRASTAGTVCSPIVD